MSFRTLVPGWYAHLAPHVHFKVRPDESGEVSSRPFPPGEPLRTVYAREPHSRREARRTPTPATGRFAAKGSQPMPGP